VAAGAPANASGEEAVALVQATHAWNPAQEPTLSDINLSVAKGQLCIVVGAVGCGKSSLLAALLGEMPRVRGSTLLRGSVAFTAQDPWIQNATVRENVLMGRPMDDALYVQVLIACALHADLDALPDGDTTQIGEKGVTLSGVTPAPACATLHLACLPHCCL
jgi:ATP-binding cassette, subfamily C (CFTR/MRP), member 1